jgi:hypothetical protein
VIEIRHVRQNRNERFRRWFSDDNFDLVVWYKPDESIDGFELSYDKTGQEKAIRWLSERGISHYLVDSGEQSPLANRTPILLATNGKPEMGRVLASFLASKEGLPVKLAMLVQSKLREYGQLDFE